MTDQGWFCMFASIAVSMICVTMCIYHCWDRWCEHKEELARIAIPEGDDE